MKKILIFSIPVILMICFVLIMTSANYLKQPTGDDDNIVKIINDMRIDVNNENWASAEDKSKLLKHAWKKITTRVQFSAERNEIKDGEIAIARIQGFVEAKDKPGILSELDELKNHWVDIGQ